MAPFSAVQVPWTTPPVIAGFLLNGWQGAVVQIVNLAIATVIYFPFLKAQDKAFLKEEMGDVEEEVTEDTSVKAEIKPAAEN
jgi:PTS system cellobiose-specific IIC component